MRVLGVDLAAQPANTAAVRLSTVDGRLVADAAGHLDDDELVELGAAADVVALDSPLGWPRTFTSFIRAVEALDPPATVDTRALSFRATDLDVRARTGLWPLSVSTDRLGVVAMRAAVLQRRWAEEWGSPAPRDGSGRLAEVYPAACRGVWGLRPRGLAHPAEGVDRRAEVVEGLVAATDGWLDLDDVVDECRVVDHVLDACCAAIGGLAVRLGLTSGPPDGAAEDAAVEGWVRVPPPLEEIGAALSHRRTRDCDT